jgi:hypothetical protein
MTHVRTAVIPETTTNASKAEDIPSRLKVCERGMAPHPHLSSVRTAVVQRAHMRRRVGGGRKEKKCMRLPNILINTHTLLLSHLSFHLRLPQCRICQRRNERGGPIIASVRRRAVRRASEGRRFLIASTNINIRRDPARQRTALIPAPPGPYNHRQPVQRLVRSCDTLMRIMTKE